MPVLGPKGLDILYISSNTSQTTTQSKGFFSMITGALGALAGFCVGGPVGAAVGAGFASTATSVATDIYDGAPVSSVRVYGYHSSVTLCRHILTPV